MDVRISQCDSSTVPQYTVSQTRRQNRIPIFSLFIVKLEVFYKDKLQQSRHQPRQQSRRQIRRQTRRQNRIPIFSLFIVKLEMFYTFSHLKRPLYNIYIYIYIYIYIINGRKKKVWFS